MQAKMKWLGAAALVLAAPASAGFDSYCESAEAAKKPDVQRAVCEFLARADYAGEVRASSFDAPQVQAKLTQLDRLGIVRAMFMRLKTGGELGWTAYVVVGQDERALDPAAVDKEISALPAAEAELKEKLKGFAAETLAEVKAHLAAIDARAAKDPEFKRVIVDGTAKAHADWKAGYDRYAPLYEKAAAFEAAAAKGDKVPGCAASLHGAVQAYLDERKPKDLSAAVNALTDDVGYVLVRDLQLCHDLDQHVAANQAFAEVLDRGGVRRGPRMSAVVATMKEVEEVRKKQKDFVSDDRKEGSFVKNVGAFFKVPVKGYSASSEQTWAPVAKLSKPKDGVVTVSFKSQKATQYLGEWRKTGRLQGFNAVGDPIEEEVWVSLGKRTITVKQYPLMVAAEQVGNLKPGMNLTLRMEQGGERAHVVSGFGDAKETKLVNYLGFKL